MVQANKTKAVSLARMRLSLLFCPVVLVLAGAALGAAVSAALRHSVHPLEMTVAAAISIVVGIFAVLPMVIMLGGSGVVLLRCATVANMARLVGIMIGGLLAVVFLPKDAHKMALIIWLVAFYFLLLIGESIVSSWVMKQSRF